MKTPALINFLSTIGLLFAFLLLAAIFIFSLQNTLKAIEPENRTMQPNQVWLLFVPIFNIYWVFKVIAAIANSSKNQLEIYGVYKEDKVMYTIGILWAVSVIFSRLPYIGTFFAFASLVLWIIYWVKVNRLRKEILSFREIYLLHKEDSVL